MSRDLDRITWLALLVVDEAAEQAERGRVPPSLGLRLALAHLCSIADGPIAALPSRRSVFDTFWKEATIKGSGNPHATAYYRASMTRSCLQQIGRQIGQSANLFNIVRAARSPDARSRKRFAEALKLAEQERAQKKWRKREGYYGRNMPD